MHLFILSLDFDTKVNLRRGQKKVTTATTCDHNCILNEIWQLGNGFVCDRRQRLTNHSLEYREIIVCLFIIAKCSNTHTNYGKLFSVTVFFTAHEAFQSVKYIYIKSILLIITSNYSRRPRQMNILVLGLDGAGKTEVQHALWNRPRTDFTPTTGCSSESFVYEDTKVQLSELGGAQGIRDIWKYYYPRVSYQPFIDAIICVLFYCLTKYLYKKKYKCDVF